jgi:mRNA-degrading endonuclease RelE of RelBE toxin-antitoxin system
MRTELITVAEPLTFMRQAESIWSDDEREAFVDFIARNPETGDVIPETGGVCKVRWGMQGRGKRGRARVIYFFHDRDAPIYLLMVYAKGARENICPKREGWCGSSPRESSRRSVAVKDGGDNE